MGDKLLHLFGIFVRHFPLVFLVITYSEVMSILQNFAGLLGSLHPFLQLNRETHRSWFSVSFLV